MMINQRNVATSIILTIVTCGIYGIYWFITATDDIKQASGDTTLPSGGVAFLLTLVTCGIYGYYWAYRMGKALSMAQAKANMPATSDNSLMFLILQFFGLNIVNLAIIQSNLNTIAGGNINNAPFGQPGQPQQPTDNNGQNNQ